MGDVALQLFLGALRPQHVSVNATHHSDVSDVTPDSTGTHDNGVKTAVYSGEYSRNAEAQMFFNSSHVKSEPNNTEHAKM